MTQSTREQEVIWRQQAEAMAQELYEALKALVRATDAEESVGEIPALRNYEERYLGALDEGVPDNR